MPLDPNWFYSTLAQSTAAIVGLGGGFLVQRILHQRNEIASPRSEVHAHTYACYLTVRDARQHADRIALSLAAAANEGQERKEAGDLNFAVTHDVYTYARTRGTYGRGNGLGGVLSFDFMYEFARAAEAAENFRDALPATFEDCVSPDCA